MCIRDRMHGVNLRTINPDQNRALLFLIVKDKETITEKMSREQSSLISVAEIIPFGSDSSSSNTEIPNKNFRNINPKTSMIPAETSQVDKQGKARIEITKRKRAGLRSSVERRGSKGASNSSEIDKSFELVDLNKTMEKTLAKKLKRVLPSTSSISCDEELPNTRSTQDMQSVISSNTSTTGGFAFPSLNLTESLLMQPLKLNFFKEDKTPQTSIFKIIRGNKREKGSAQM
eukprot:TRINITY_DN12496_c0_g1_i2.p1 TRINITY_DN12496_c0_g1~~TRINITY_DN12496_c0_g1_i2.p1  ORF type:complete len:231 (-),score=24.69 TRINITY_DN12496_c0_g1_i2:176-868(-)